MSSYLDDFFRAVRFKSAGTLLAARPYLNVEGGTLTDDAPNDATKLVISAGGPVTLFDHDYAADATTADFASGNVTIGGVTWKFREQNTEPNKRVLAGSGIQIGGTTGAACTLTCPLLTLAPTLSFARRICVDIRMTHPVTVHDYRVGLTDTTRDQVSPNTDWNNNGFRLLVRQGFSSSAMKSFFKYDGTETAVFSDGIGITHDIFRFVVDGPVFSFFSGTWASGWATDASMMRRGAHFWTQTTAQQVDNADLGIVLCHEFASGTQTISNIRIREL